MVRIEVEKDRVIMAFDSNRRDTGLLPDAARRVAEGLDKAADLCEGWVNSGGAPEVLKGRTRGVKVRSGDGRVWMRFDSIVDRESVPYSFARLLAAALRSTAIEAQHRCRLEFKHKRLFGE